MKASPPHREIRKKTLNQDERALVTAVAEFRALSDEERAELLKNPKRSPIIRGYLQATHPELLPFLNPDDLQSREAVRDVALFGHAMKALFGHLRAAVEDPAVKGHTRVHGIARKLLDDIRLGLAATEIPIATEEWRARFRDEVRSEEARARGSVRAAAYEAMSLATQRLARSRHDWKSRKDAARVILEEIKKMPEWKIAPLRETGRKSAVSRVLRWLPADIKTQRGTGKKK